MTYYLYMYSTLYQFKNCWVHIVYQVTIHKCSKCSPPEWTHGHVWLWTVAHFQKSRGSCEWFDRRQGALVKYLFILSWSWIHGGGDCGSKCLHKPKCKGLRSGERGTGSRKLSSLRMNIVIFCPYLCLGKSWSLHKPFRYIVYFNSLSSAVLIASNCRMISK